MLFCRFETYILGGKNTKKAAVKDKKKRVPTIVETLLVPGTGLEPARLAAHAPETCASTNSAIRALVDTLFYDVMNMNHTKILVVVVNHKEVGDILRLHQLQCIDGEGRI